MSITASSRTRRSNRGARLCGSALSLQLLSGRMAHCAWARRLHLLTGVSRSLGALAGASLSRGLGGRWLQHTQRTHATRGVAWVRVDPHSGPCCCLVAFWSWCGCVREGGSSFDLSQFITLQVSKAAAQTPQTGQAQGQGHRGTGQHTASCMSTRTGHDRTTRQLRKNKTASGDGTLLLPPPATGHRLPEAKGERAEDGEREQRRQREAT